jgi:hypothetical protein
MFLTFLQQQQFLMAFQRVDCTEGNWGVCGGDYLAGEEIWHEGAK